jgi:radical SAM protein with 4Fe4S-binding SPASM domain
MDKDPYVTKLGAGEFTLWSGQQPLLSRLDMELTERCNNDCIHCYINRPASDRAARGRELATVEIQGILHEAASLGALAVTFTGGEPLLRDDFCEIYIFARRLGLRVRLLTNATLISPQLAKLFARIPPLEKVQITLYGMSVKSYEAVTRTPGAFERAWRGIHLLLQEGVPFVVRGVRLPPNEHEVDEFAAWAGTIPWMDHPPSCSVFFDLRGRRDSEQRNRRIKELRSSPEEGVAFLARRQGEYLKDMKRLYSQFAGPAADRLFSCGAGVGGGCVDAYGQLQPCMLLRHPDTVYDLQSGSLEDALTRFFPQMRERRADHAGYLARCARCFIRGLCDQCPAKSWMEHGTLDTPVEYLCQVAHVQAKILGLLAENERAWEVRDWKQRQREWLS